MQHRNLKRQEGRAAGAFGERMEEAQCGTDSRRSEEARRHVIGRKIREQIGLKREHNDMNPG